MWPTIFRFENTALYSYTFFVSLAFLVGLFCFYQLTQAKISARHAINGTLFASFVGFVGARLLFVITQWDKFIQGDFSILRPWEGGVVFLGGFLTGALALFFYAKRKNLPLSYTFSAAAPSLAIAHAVGRIGCFLNGCCFGSHCTLPWAVTYTHELSAAPLFEKLHPTQLYEIIVLLFIFLLLKALHKNEIKVPKKYKAHPGILYLYLYGTLRFFIEFFRGDIFRGIWGPFSTSQWVSLCLIFLALFLDFRRHQSHN